MIYHYLKITLRNLSRQKLHSIINILGLSLGLAISMLILVYVLHELSYDRFFDNHDRIYRIHTTSQIGSGEPQTLPTSMYPIGELAIDELPGIENFTRFTRYYTSPSITHDDKTITLPGIIFADSTFFSIINLEFLAGNPSTALNESRPLVLTESSASLLFNDPRQAYNKTVQLQNETYRITGVVKDLPENTHMSFSGVSAHYDLPNNIKASGMNFFTYFKIVPGTDKELLESKLDNITTRSGLYPAFYLSSFNPVKTLKGETIKGSKGKHFRRSLVVFQFALTIFIISTLLVISNQIRYMQTKDLGLDREQILLIQNVSPGIYNSFQSVRPELEAISHVKGVTGSNYVYGGSNRIDLVSEQGVAKETGVTADIITVDENFLEVMDINLAEGRNFHAGSETDIQYAFILNQTAVNTLGFEEPLNKQLEIFIEKRVKEMGVRKVLGASTANLLWIFNKETFLLVIIALLLAIPPAWMLMEKWLDTFASSIAINPLWFLLPGLATLLLSSLTITLQAWIVSQSNPVEALRSE